MSDTTSLSLNRRLILVVVLVGAFALAAFALEWWVTWQHQRHIARIEQESLMLARLSTLETDLLEQTSAQYAYLLTRDPSAHAVAQQQTARIEAALDDLLADTSSERRIADVMDNFRTANSLYASLAAMVQSGQSPDNATVIRFVDTSKSTIAALRTVVEAQARTLETLRTAETSLATWLRLAFVLQILFLVSLVWGMWRMAAWVAHDMRLLQEAAQHVEKTLDPLTEVVRAFAEGDIGVAVEPSPPLTLPTPKSVEFARVQRVFAQTVAHVDEMQQALGKGLEHLRVLIANVTVQGAHLAQAGQELQSAAEQTGYATQQIAETMHQLSQGTVQQASDAATVAHAIDQIARAADGVAQGASEQVAAMQRTNEITEKITNGMDSLETLARQASTTSAELNEAATEGRERLDAMQAFLERMHSQIEETAQAVARMDEQSEAIGFIVRTIDEIADKTDILALNAAVEAARAGEQGRGFTVIAEQIRKLSEDAKRSTADITSMIRDVQHDMSATGQAVRAVGQAIREGLAQIEQTEAQFQRVFAAARATDDVSQVLYKTVSEVRRQVESVAESVQTVVSITEENSAATQQMAASIHEIRQAVESLASISEETSAGVQQVSASTEELSAQVEEMMASAQQLAEMANTLRRLVKHYINDVEADQPKEASNEMLFKKSKSAHTHRKFVHEGDSHER